MEQVWVENLRDDAVQKAKHLVLIVGNLRALAGSLSILLYAASLAEERAIIHLEHNVNLDSDSQDEHGHDEVDPRLFRLFGARVLCLNLTHSLQH